MATAIRADKNIPTQQSNAEDWIVWYKSFPWSMSTDHKNVLFLAMWRRNGSSNANTDALRSFLKEEAGISLTTSGIGVIQEAGWSFLHGIENVVGFSAYAIGAWILLLFALLGFGVFQAFRNPEATGKILGIAAKTAAKA